jgi:hypothetical protein
VATDRVTSRSEGGGRNAQGSRAVEGGVRSLNPSAQKPCWFRILQHSTSRTPWSSGSRCSSSPVRVTGGASCRRTGVRSSLSCTCAATTPSPASRHQLRDIRRHRPRLHPRRHRTARRSRTGPSQNAARARSGLRPAGRDVRRVRPRRRQPCRLLRQAAPARCERPGRHRLRWRSAVDLARPAGPHPRSNRRPHPQDRPDLRATRSRSSPIAPTRAPASGSPPASNDRPAGSSLPLSAPSTAPSPRPGPLSSAPWHG